MNYWKQCVENYTKKLNDDISGKNTTNAVEDPVEELVAYNLLLGKTKEASSALENAG